VSPPSPKTQFDDGLGAGRSILALAQPAQETDDLLTELAVRPDLHLLRVMTVAAAVVALRDLEIRLVLTCTETAVEDIDELLQQVDRLRPGIPILALRERSGEVSARWKACGVGVLRAPLLPGVLSRTVDVALGLVEAKPGRPAAGR
jgi:hypothetical protein